MAKRSLEFITCHFNGYLTFMWDGCSGRYIDPHLQAGGGKGLAKIVWQPCSTSPRIISINGKKAARCNNGALGWFMDKFLELYPTRRLLINKWKRGLTAFRVAQFDMRALAFVAHDIPIRCVTKAVVEKFLDNGYRHHIPLHWIRKFSQRTINKWLTGMGGIR